MSCQLIKKDSAPRSYHSILPDGSDLSNVECFLIRHQTHIKFKSWRVISWPHFNYKNWDCRYRDCGMGWMNQGSNSGRENRHFLFSTTSRQALGLRQPPIQWILAIFHGIKRPGPDTIGHSPPSLSDVKSGALRY